MLVSSLILDLAYSRLNFNANDDDTFCPFIFSEMCYHRSEIVRVFTFIEIHVLRNLSA